MIILICPSCESDKIEFLRTDFNGKEIFYCEECNREFSFLGAEWRAE